MRCGQQHDTLGLLGRKSLGRPVTSNPTGIASVRGYGILHDEGGTAYGCYRFEVVLALLPQLSGRGVGPRNSSGTLQLSTRCSSAALLPSRSLAVRACAPIWLGTIS